MILQDKIKSSLTSGKSKNFDEKNKMWSDLTTIVPDILKHYVQKDPLKYMSCLEVAR